MNMYVHGPEDNETQPEKACENFGIARSISSAMAEYERARNNPWAGKWADGASGRVEIEPSRNENHGQTFYDIAVGSDVPVAPLPAQPAIVGCLWNGRHVPAKSIFRANKTPHIYAYIMADDGDVTWWRCVLPFGVKYLAGYGRTQLGAYYDWVRKNRQWADEM